MLVLSALIRELFFNIHLYLDKIKNYIDLICKDLIDLHIEQN